MSDWVSYGPGLWRHRPWWKVAVNTFLRFVQTRKRPARLLVVATKCEDDPDDGEKPPVVTGYALRRVLHL